MHVGLSVWLLTILGFAVVLGVDLFVVGRRARMPSMVESALWVTLYVGLAVAFGVALAFVEDSSHSGQFFAGWLTEYSLSLDNLFVFMLLLRRFRVPVEAQRTVLIVGIVIALVLRGIFIALGAAAIHQFIWVFYLFGAFLVWTAVRLLFETREGGDAPSEPNEDRGPDDTLLVRLARRVLPTTPDYDGVRLRVTRDGRRLFTPMLLVMVAIGSTDVLFALDSIPAIFGLTRVPYLVFVANGFALLGLVQLFFLLGGLLDRLVYLSLGLATVLGFIGVKLVLDALADNTLPFVNGGEPVEWVPEIPITVSLGVIGGVLVVTMLASIVKSRLDARAATRV
jgi:tellurite resistance protein TerC